MELNISFVYFFQYILEAYHIDIYNRKTDIDSFIVKDLSNDKIASFAKFVKLDRRDYTLGQMVWIMGLIKSGGKTLLQSDLLQDFREFTLRYFEEKIIDKDYLELINTVKEDFRNKAAHPHILGIDVAQECQNLLRVTLKELLANYLR